MAGPTSKTLGTRPFNIHYVGPDQFLLDDGGSELRVVDSGALHMANLCRDGASLQEHTELVIAAGGGMIAPAHLSELAETRLFVDYENLPPPLSSPANRVSVIGIPTADRPALLQRCIASLIQNCDVHEESPDLLVVDGSGEERNRQLTRHVVSEARPRWRGRVSYVGRDEADLVKRAIAARSGVHLSLLDLGFTPGSTGASRNLILVLARHRQVLMVDDDVVCRTWKSGSDSGLAYIGHAEPCNVSCFASRSDAIASVSFGEASLISAHSQLLGRSLASLRPRPGDRPVVRNPCSHLVAALDGTHSSQVVVTIAGLVGDGGLYCPYRLLFTAPAENHIAYRAEEEYYLATTSRERTKIAPRPTITHDAGCMAYCMGIANDRDLPMFGPTGRNQDGLFGRLLSFCDEHAFFGHVPVGIVHDSTRPAGYEKPMRSATENLLNDCISILISGYRPSRLPVSDRLQWLGCSLSAMARLPEREFRSELRSSILERRSADFVAADRLLASCPSPSPWRDLDIYRQRYLEAVQSDEFFVPAEFRDRGGIVAFRQYLGVFGDLISHWTACLTVADEIDLCELLPEATHPHSRTSALTAGV